MKLCPQCHFTFEDRDWVCDFDGSELTPFDDPAPLSDRIVPPSKKSHLLRFANSWRGLAGLAGLALLSGTFLIGRYKTSSSPESDVKVPTTELPEAIVTSAPTRKSRRRMAHTHKADHHTEATIVRASTARRISTPARTTARVRHSSTAFRKQSVALSEKKDSRVDVVFRKTGNALKKTVSILKKPFDF